MTNPVFVVLGATLAALIAGFFSYVNLVSAKENKVSEFRLGWIDGLREEIATFTAGVQDLARMEAMRTDWNPEDYGDDSVEARDIKWMNETRDSYVMVVASLSKIQLRLNPRHIAENPEGPEAKLMEALETARQVFSDRKFEEAIRASEKIRLSAAPLLKSTWDDVKNGELRYRQVREYAEEALTVGLGLVGMIAIIYVVLISIGIT